MTLPAIEKIAGELQTHRSQTRPLNHGLDSNEQTGDPTTKDMISCGSALPEINDYNSDSKFLCMLG